MEQKMPRLTERIRAAVVEYTGKILDILITGYLALIIVVMPFYFQEGYNHIGTDKSLFFRTCTRYAACIFLPLAAVRGICIFAGWLSRRNWHQNPQNAAQGEKSTNLHFSITDFFALGYGFIVLLSYLCSDYRETALWGTFGWYMGMIPQLMLVGIYFAVSRLRQKKNRVIGLFFPVSAAVFLLGILNRFDIWPLRMENSGLPDFISTIGNINWYCGYLVSVLFLGVGLFWMDKGKEKRKTILLALYCFIGFTAAVTQGSDSGVFALGSVLLAMFLLSAWKVGEDMAHSVQAEEKEQRINRFWQLLTILGCACVATALIRKLYPERINYTSFSTDLLTTGKIPPLLLALAAAGWGILSLSKENQKYKSAVLKCHRFLARGICTAIPVVVLSFILMIAANTARPGCLGSLSDRDAFTFRAEWGSKRGATWSAGWRCFADQNLLHKLFGVGPDCMADYLYSDADAALLQDVKQVFGEMRLTNAHCEWLTVLVNSGLLGAMAFAGIMVSAMLRQIACGSKISAKAAGSGREPRETAGSKASLATACGLCVLAYICNGIWSFQQSMGVATIFVVLGIGENCLRFSGSDDIID